MRNDHLVKFVLIQAVVLSAIGQLHAGEGVLLGHWKLAGDASDASGNNLRSENHGADLTAPGPEGQANGAARFDGRKAFIEVPSQDNLNLGADDFTLAVWVHTEERLDDVLGDILSKFDPAARRGINWCIRNSSGTSGSQSNYRNVHFGVDAGTEPKWTDCGRPGDAIYVTAVASHDGELFAGVCEPNEGQTGHVYQYAGGERWIDCGSPDGSNAVMVVATHGGKLYAGTGRYNLSGSALPESPNATAGGKVFRYEGDGRWTDCGKLGDSDAVGGLVVYRGELYGTSLYRPAGMFRYAGGTQWVACSLPKDGRRVVSPAVFNGHLYAGTFDGCAIYRFDGESWFDAVELEPSGQTYSLEVHAGELCVGTWPSGRVYRSSDGAKWKDAGRLGAEAEVMGMAVHNGKLYGGTLPLAEVYRFDGDGAWQLTGRVDHSPDVRYRRAWSMAVHDGRLYCGTLPSGHVYAMTAGVSVTHDRELEPGWRHLAAVRQGTRLIMYVDGQVVAESPPKADASLDVSNDEPLRIGFGEHDYFRGSLCDLRLYRGALSTDEIAELLKAAR